MLAFSIVLRMFAINWLLAELTTVHKFLFSLLYTPSMNVLLIHGSFPRALNKLVFVRMLYILEVSTNQKEDPLDHYLLNQQWKMTVFSRYVPLVAFKPLVFRLDVHTGSCFRSHSSAWLYATC